MTGKMPFDEMKEAEIGWEKKLEDLLPRNAMWISGV